MLALAERIIVSLSEPYLIEGHRMVIGVSVGIAIAPEDGVTSEAVSRHVLPAEERRTERHAGATRGGYEPQCNGPRPFSFVLHGVWPQFEKGWPENCQTPGDSGYVPRPVAQRKTVCGWGKRRNWPFQPRPSPISRWNRGAPMC